MHLRQDSITLVDNIDPNRTQCSYVRQMGNDRKEIPRPPSEAPNSSDVLYYNQFKVEQHCSKKNNWTIGLKRGGGSNFAKRTGFSPFIRSSKKSAHAQRLLVQLLSGGVRHPDASFPLSFPLRVMFEFKLKNHFTKKNTVNRKSGDLSNIAQSIEDCLQKSEVILDDALICDAHFTKKFGPENSVEVWIFKA